MDTGRVLHYILSNDSFPPSSELRKRWLVALRLDNEANSRVSESTVLCSERSLRQIFTFLPVPKSLWTLPLPIMAKKGRPVASWKQMQCHRCIYLFFFAPASLRAPVSHRMSVDYECRERHGPERKCSVDSRWPNDENNHYRKLAKSEGLQRQRSKVRAESADRAANTRCTLGQHAVCMLGDDDIGDKPVQEARLTSRLLGLFFLLKYSFRRAMLQLEFGESKPDESQSEQSITETIKAARSWSSETLKSTQIADRPRPDALSQTQTFFGKVLYWQHGWKENDKKRNQKCH